MNEYIQACSTVKKIFFDESMQTVNILSSMPVTKTADKKKAVENKLFAMT